MKEYAAFRKLKCTCKKGEIVVEFYQSMRHKEYKECINVSIYRQVCQDFVFGTDYEEYLYSLNFSDASLIYKGVVQEDPSKKYYCYVDTDVKEDKVYAYYIKSDINDIVTGPYAVKVRNKKLWLSYDAIKEKMNEIKNKYPDVVTIKNHGYSMLGRAINSLTIGNKEHITLSFVGLIHAGESGPEIMLYVIEKLLENDSDLLKKVGISFLMNANPDMREKMVQGTPWYLRTNSNGVDINRNFNCQWEIVEYGYGLQTDVTSSNTYRGPYPESEAETKAVLDFHQYSKSDAVFVFHCLSGICTDSFLVSKYSKEDKEYIKKCMTYLKPYTKGFGVKDDVSIYYGTSYGSFPHYLYKKYGLPAFDMELGEVKEDVKEMVIHDHVTETLMEEYQKRHYEGIREVVKNVYS